ncbi:MAG: hypothetical protein A2W25_12420 [candidate division Zixibacteria bacterium RBG_16_53_22]|nr:MAG: hypothetical protein A2W25_12420 [candidate division Zixibacteria bacterium RBG_16_53_22]
MNDGQNSKLAKSLILDLVFLAFIIYRFLILNNDTPFGISTGQELSTDPPQYTSFARNKALFNSYEIFHSRYTFFVNNVTTIIAYPIFRLLGTGRAQANFVALALSLLVMLFSYNLWKERSHGQAMLGTVFLGFNYIFINYGTLTFLEVTTLALISSASYFLLKKSQRVLHSFAAGMLFAAAAFFGKLLAIAFLPLAALILIIELLQKAGRSWHKFNVLYSFLIGYAFILILWTVFMYMPARADVGGYISEISTGMYGFPKALESVKMFLVQFYSYGFDIRLWSKQTIILVAGFLGLASVIGISLAPSKQLLQEVDRTDLFNAFWLLGMFVFLFPWNYRPMRYAMIIFPPAAYLSARWLILLTKTNIDWGNRIWPFFIMVYMAGSYISAQLLLIPKFDMRSIEIIQKYIPAAMLMGIVVTLTAIAIHKYKLKEINFVKNISLFIMPLAIIAFVINQNWLFFGNNFKLQKTISNSSRDLGRVLSKDAVVIGSYSSALTQENNFGSVIKMFGVPVVEKNFFNDIPATHVAIEAGGGEGSNERRAFKDYPEIMNNAPLVTTYYLRGYPINVYLIAPNSPNLKAKQYMPSSYESAVIALLGKRIDLALVMLDEYERLNGETISSVLLRMRIQLVTAGENPNYEYLESLVQLDEGNMNYWWLLGDSYIKSTPPQPEKALRAYQKALHLRPDDKSILKQLEILRNYIKNT